MTPEDIATLRELVRRLDTQDCHGTSEPYYLVQEHCETVVGQDYGYDRRVCIKDGEELGDKVSSRILRRIDLGCDAPEGVDVLHLAEHWEAVEAYLTLDSARARCEGNKKLRVYTQSAHRNFEVRFIRRVLPELLKLVDGPKEGA